MEGVLSKPKLTGFAKRLVTDGLLDEAQTQTLLEQSAQQQIPFMMQLAQESAVDQKRIAQTASEHFGVPFFDLKACNPEHIPQNLLKTELVQKHYGLPLFAQNNHLYVATIDPTLPMLNELNFLTGLTTYPLLVEAKKLHRLIDIALNNPNASVADLDAALDNTQKKSKKKKTKQDSEIDKSPVVQFINKILHDAANQKASDIHFEPYEDHYRIRFRQDGILHEVAAPPSSVANYLVTRLKVMANLDISERRLPQDGRFQLSLAQGNPIDFRVSTCPTLYGEKVVTRLLESSPELLDVDKLGMEEDQKRTFLDAIQQTQGIVLVTGPTGSGKTVSLYTALKILNTPKENISTVEDPVEIRLSGINQVQINSKAGLTFAKVLRAFLRQDPNIIMVGEIRDLETAEIAVKASQTGHLVLSTLHTNSASETLIRLANMGIAPYNIASTIVLIMAQRLVRHLCEHCKQPTNIPEAALLKEGFTKKEISTLKLFTPNPKGCDDCKQGYKGRLGIYEVMPLSKDMGRLIMDQGNAMDIADQAKKEGVLNLREAGLAKVRQGVTSLDEINRVITR